MDDSERSIESFDFFNESETLALEEVEIEQTGRVGTLEVPLITNIVKGRGGQGQTIASSLFMPDNLRNFLLTSGARNR